MNVVSIVANVVKERDYYKESFEECRAIIKQLTEGPGEFEYIHPFDIAEMINDPNSNQIIDPSGLILFPKTRKKYKESVNIPAKTKNIK